MSDILDMVKKAQAEQNGVVGGHRIAVLQSIDVLTSIGGKDDYVANLRCVLGAYPDGMALSKVQTVLPNGADLTKARDELKESGELEETSKGNSVVLKLKAA